MAASGPGRGVCSPRSRSPNAPLAHTPLSNQESGVTLALTTDRLGVAYNHFTSLRSHLLTCQAKVTFNTYTSSRAAVTASQASGEDSIQDTCHPKGTSRPPATPRAHVALLSPQWHVLPSYLNVGQQLLLPPPDVLQLLTLLCSQVTGDCRRKVL